MLAPEEEEVVQADNIPPEVLAGRQVQIGINPLSPRSKQRAEQVLLVHPVWQLMRCGWCQEVVGEEQNAVVASEADATEADTDDHMCNIMSGAVPGYTALDEAGATEVVVLHDSDPSGYLVLLLYTGSV